VLRWTKPLERHGHVLSLSTLDRFEDREAREKYCAALGGYSLVRAATVNPHFIPHCDRLF
jgi:hypothetical protein